MKCKKYFALVLFVIVLFTGCSKAPKPVEAEIPEPESIEEEAKEPDVSLYEQFLANEVTVHINGGEESDAGYFFSLKDMDEQNYTLEELVKEIIDAHSFSQETPDTTLRSIMYSYIDCGKDGIPELAIIIDTPQGVEQWQEVLIIKEIDGNLETVYSTVAWSRFYVYLNEYGYIYNDGSGGASHHQFDKEYIDGDGKYHFIYQSNTNAYSYPGDEEMDIYLIEFNFSNTKTDEGWRPAEYYAFGLVNRDQYPIEHNGFKGYCYDCMVENLGNIDTEPYMQDLSSISTAEEIPLSEAEERIAQNEEFAGLTEEIKNGKEADWKVLEESFDVPRYEEAEVQY